MGTEKNREQGSLGVKQAVPYTTMVKRDVE
jgi:hypothetical protein